MLSGSGARAMMLETMNNFGVGIRHVRHAVSCALIADAARILTSILVGYWFFH